MIYKLIVPLFVIYMVGINCQDETNKTLTSISAETTTKMNDANNLIKIQFLYESHCKHSRNFASNAFKSTILDLGSYLDLHLYPFGIAALRNDGNITCQHGPAECYGNKLHACAIDQLNNATLSALYISCLMDSSQAARGSDDAAADACGKSMNVDAGLIKECAKSAKGEDLLRFYGEESNEIMYWGVPFILINGEIKGRDTFKADVCKAFKNPPKQCSQ